MEIEISHRVDALDLLANAGYKLGCFADLISAVDSNDLILSDSSLTGITLMLWDIRDNVEKAVRLISEAASPPQQTAEAGLNAAASSADN